MLKESAVLGTDWALRTSQTPLAETLQIISPKSHVSQIRVNHPSRSRSASAPFPPLLPPPHSTPSPHLRRHCASSAGGCTVCIPPPPPPAAFERKKKKKKGASLSFHRVNPAHGIQHPSPSQVCKCPTTTWRTGRFIRGEFLCSCCSWPNALPVSS